MIFCLSIEGFGGYIPSKNGKKMYTLYQIFDFSQTFIINVKNIFRLNYFFMIFGAEAIFFNVCCIKKANNNTFLHWFWFLIINETCLNRNPLRAEDFVRCSWQFGLYRFKKLWNLNKVISKCVWSTQVANFAVFNLDMFCYHEKVGLTGSLYL